MYKRIASLEICRRHTCFLWGARQTGKSTLLRERFPDAVTFDLLLSDEYRRCLQNPSIIRQELSARGLTGDNQTAPVIIDEIQKVPDLLDEVHWMIERMGLRFVLCGSSARKVRRSQANLLGGRAPSLNLHPLTFAEIPDFDLTRALNRGLLPPHYDAEDHDILRNAYVGTYLREEVAAEAVVRNLPAFGRFLEIAALSNGEMIVYQNIARDCGVSSPSVKAYFELLAETLLGRWLPAYTRRARRRVILAPRFYLFDVGIAAALARRARIEPGSELWGRALEHFIFMELSAYRDYKAPNLSLAYWRTTSQLGVDFILADGAVAVEVKSTRMAGDHDLRGLRAFKEEHKPRRTILVSMDAKPRRTDDGVDILPWRVFLEELWSENIVAAT
ncbi:MAG: ATP-binding protein [Lentisphaerae bacterium]|jgi:predicted AAA+ superfamily ATPase|nr:ATP-binding protein [Lentisphaerota bacterium]